MGSGPAARSCSQFLASSKFSRFGCADRLAVLDAFFVQGDSFKEDFFAIQVRSPSRTLIWRKPILSRNLIVTVADADL